MPKPVKISKSDITKLQIIRVATKNFLENGYSNTSAKKICDELGISPGNLTFYFPTKEHLLATLVDLLCDFQWKMMKEEADDGISSIMAICLELTAMTAMCDEDEIARDFYISTYTSPICLDRIRRNDADRAKKVFKEYCPNWTDEQFAMAEMLVSGAEYAALVQAGYQVSLEMRIEGALRNILRIHNVPEDLIKLKIDKVFALDYRSIGRKVLKKFKEFAEAENENAFIELFGG